MVDAFRAALDELMGKDRDLPPEERKGRRARFYDPEVCKHALCGLCPYTLFFNTKSDLGPCEYELHEEHLDFESCKGEWDGLSQREKDKYGYERALLKILQRLVSDMDRKIEKQQERARLESQPRIPSPPQQAELDALRQKAKEATDESERLAEAGEIDASMAVVQTAERLRAEHERLAKKYTEPERYIMVCEVCGVFIQSTDNEARRRDHIEGKQYLGWKAIREKCGELEKKYLGAVQLGGLPASILSWPGGAGGPSAPGGGGGGGGGGSGANALPVAAPRERERERAERSQDRGEREEGEVRGEHSDRERSRRRYDEEGRSGGSRGYDDERRDDRRGGSRYREERDRERGYYDRERGRDDRERRRDDRRDRDRSYERRDRRSGGAEVPPPDYHRSGSRGGSRGYY